MDEQAQVPLTWFTIAKLSPALMGKANCRNSMSYSLVNQSSVFLHMCNFLYMGLKVVMQVDELVDLLIVLCPLAKPPFQYSIFVDASFQTTIHNTNRPSKLNKEGTTSTKIKDK